MRNSKCRGKQRCEGGDSPPPSGCMPSFFMHASRRDGLSPPSTALTSLFSSPIPSTASIAPLSLTNKKHHRFGLQIKFLKLISNSAPHQRNLCIQSKLGFGFRLKHSLKLSLRFKEEVEKMQQRGGRGGGDPFGGFGDHRSLVSNFFGGREDPFEDPFFTRSFGGSSIFGSSMFGGPHLFPIGVDGHRSTFIDDQPAQGNRPRGPIIEEINSDDERDKKAKFSEDKKENPRKHSRSDQHVYVEDPDDVAQETRIRATQHRNDFNTGIAMQPQTQSFSFQSSTVTYGGANGAYYTSSTTKRMASDGVVLEESKEADTTTGKAKHRVSRGIRNKGHTVTRKLNSDGKVDTMQTLHNLNQEELPVFEEAWKGNAAKHLPCWSEGLDMYGNVGPSNSRQQGRASRGGWALPATEQQRNPNKRGLQPSKEKFNQHNSEAQSWNPH